MTALGGHGLSTSMTLILLFMLSIITFHTNLIASSTVHQQGGVRALGISLDPHSKVVLAILLVLQSKGC